MATPHPGKWELVLNGSACQLSTQDFAVHAGVVANRNTGDWKVLYFQGSQRSYIWDPASPTQVSGPQKVPDWPVAVNGHDPPNFFCSGHAHMEDGRLLVAGGQRSFAPPPSCPPTSNYARIPYAYFFDPITEAWSAAGPSANPHQMADGRWYPTLTTLGEGPGYGRLLAMSGFRKNLGGLQGCNHVVNTDPEMYRALDGWSQMEDPQEATQPFSSLYPGAHVIPYGTRAGKVFYSMPMTQAWVFDPFAPVPPTNGGYWEAVGGERATHRHDGNSVLLPLLPGSTSAKVLILGGDNPGTETAEVIDVASGSPSWSSVAPMFFKRRNANAVLLPDDTVLVVGGNLNDSPDDPVYTAEAYDVATDAWRLLPAMNRQRVYHSTAVLLPDGRVWAAGSLADPAFERNVELYSPGYLFEGTRPVIVSAPSAVHYGQPFEVETTGQIAAVRLIRRGVSTHSTNMDQRSVGLAFSKSGKTNGTAWWDVTAPANADVAPPGMYMLFVLRAKAESLSGQTAIPSVAKVVNVRYPTP